MRLVLEQVASGYGSATVLRGIDLTVPAGEAVAVLGRNGMGKTTLLRTVLGFVKPMAGAINLDGSDITGALPERVVRRGLAYAPQDEAVFADLSVDENLLAASRRRIDPVRRRAVLDRFPVLGQRLRQRAGTLSGGEQKMLLLARALLAAPGLMVLDEITAGLQPAVVQAVVDALRWERETRGTTMLIVEQNIDASLAVADRLLVMKVGQFSAELAAGRPDLRDHLLERLAP